MLDFKLSIEAYHAMAPVSKSQLDDINVSPFHFYSRHRDPNRPPRETRSGQLEGQLAHCAILEPDAFATRYVIGPSVHRGTKAWKEFVEAHPHQVAIQQDQADIAWHQSNAVWSITDIGDALSAGKAEVSAFWTDPDTGIECRCRPDFVHELDNTSVVLLDVKTFSSADPDEFRRQAARKRYHVQAAYYTDGYAAASGIDVAAFIFVAVETEWPYAASALMLTPESIEQGRADYLRNLRTYARCMETGEWPGYARDITMISLPQWAFNDEA
ncbi:PD-(D/E)XK nuclease-like domain-containing protein [Burkholderia gladioli]|uniref:PD-(D/E)XK nuclease-like domain-containing protein n=1 Tax=Burkholderia gladioli TaxID=28095 RepID=UPI001C5F66C0|nr:PD-(D/E)XK nuclease-like domain-containing protein [Burkholderia gladioli]MBW5285977.1 PD-(D/E)XK nuclease-like domain-containing protein [Burkholderia gladioli]